MGLRSLISLLSQRDSLKMGHLLDLVRDELSAFANSAVSAHSPTEAANDSGVHRRWSIQFAGLAPIDAIFHPEATRDEALAAFPGSVVATPLPAAVSHPVTPAEAAELRKLIALILPDADGADRAEALAVALADPGAALRSFRALAADLERQPPTDADDRRTCQQCTSLSPDGRCRAAGRGELPYVASRIYSPVLDVPKRCEGYRPTAADPDQRPGVERWPGLKADADRETANPRIPYT